MRYCLLGLIVGCFACKNQRQKAGREFEAVKNILATEPKAHLTKDVSLLFSNDMNTVLDITSGVVKAITPEEGRQRFNKYFSSVEFIKWEDIAEPIFYFLMIAPWPL